MDDRRFDSLVKSLAAARNRRSVLKGLVGLGAAAVAGTTMAGDAEAARRGYSGPKFPTPAGPVVGGPEACNGQHCNVCQQCVDGVCTYSPKESCYDHTAQCLTSVCDPDTGCSYPFDCRVRDGCCGFYQYCDSSNGVCMDCPGNLCQASAAGPVCCSGATPNCCYQNGTVTCVAADVCCSVGDCPGCQQCENGTCVRNNDNCYNHTDQCLYSVCDWDGSCSNFFDCNVRDGCCTAPETCNGFNGKCEAPA